MPGRPLLNYSSRQIKTYKQLRGSLPLPPSLSLSLPTSHFLYMLSLNNTWLLRMEKKYLILGDVCVINIRGEEEVSPAPWRRGGEEEARGERREADANVWLKNDKWHETEAFQARFITSYFLRHLDLPVTSQGKWNELGGLLYTPENSKILYKNRYDPHFLFTVAFIYLWLSGGWRRRLGHGDETTLKAPSGAANPLESSPQKYCRPCKSS